MWRNVFCVLIPMLDLRKNFLFWPDRLSRLLKTPRDFFFSHFFYCMLSIYTVDAMIGIVWKMKKASHGYAHKCVQIFSRCLCLEKHLDPSPPKDASHHTIIFLLVLSVACQSWWQTEHWCDAQLQHKKGGWLPTSCNISFDTIAPTLR